MAVGPWWTADVLVVGLESMESSLENVGDWRVRCIRCPSTKQTKSLNSFGPLAYGCAAGKLTHAYSAEVSADVRKGQPRGRADTGRLWQCRSDCASSAHEQADTRANSQGVQLGRRAPLARACLLPFL
jgi:hypothetical protein